MAHHIPGIIIYISIFACLNLFISHVTCYMSYVYIYILFCLAPLRWLLQIATNRRFFAFCRDPIDGTHWTNIWGWNVIDAILVLVPFVASIRGPHIYILVPSRVMAPIVLVRQVVRLWTRVFPEPHEGESGDHAAEDQCDPSVGEHGVAPATQNFIFFSAWGAGSKSSTIGWRSQCLIFCLLETFWGQIPN